MTTSSTIVVNGIVASVFTVDENEKEQYLKIMGVPVLHLTTLLQVITAPVRFWCMNVDGGVCEQAKQIFDLERSTRGKILLCRRIFCRQRRRYRWNGRRICSYGLGRRTELASRGL